MYVQKNIVRFEHETFNQNNSEQQITLKWKN
jgi:hypothetical protein